jgi:hypothetical protein
MRFPAGGAGVPEMAARTNNFTKKIDGKSI